MKYVKAVVNLNGVEMAIPFIFPNQVVHSIAAESILEICAKHWPKAKVKIETAGFANLGVVRVSGESESLNLKSHPDDAIEINLCDYIQFR